MLRRAARCRQPVSGRLVGGGPHEDLVQGEETLAVIEARSNHGALLDTRGGTQELGGIRRRMRHQYAGVAVGFGIDPDDRLPVQVLGDVGHEAVLADHDHQVFGREEESGDVFAFDSAAAPIEGIASVTTSRARLV